MCSFTSRGLSHATSSPVAIAGGTSPLDVQAPFAMGGLNAGRPRPCSCTTGNSAWLIAPRVAFANTGRTKRSSRLPVASANVSIGHSRCSACRTGMAERRTCQTDCSATGEAQTSTSPRTGSRYTMRFLKIVHCMPQSIVAYPTPPAHAPASQRHCGPRQAECCCHTGGTPTAPRALATLQLPWRLSWRCLIRHPLHAYVPACAYHAFPLRDSL